MKAIKKNIFIVFCGLSFLCFSNSFVANATKSEFSQKTETISKKTPQQEKSIINRFLKGDKRLSNKDISYIYYNYKVENGDSIKDNLISKIDLYTRNRNYEMAQSLAESSFAKLPYAISLINRACDLAQHNKSDDVDLFVWQLAGLFYAISTSGDGNSFEKAYKVRTLQDAYLFETLWQQTPMNSIIGKEEVTKDKNKYYVLSVRNTENKLITKCYFVIHKP